MTEVFILGAGRVGSAMAKDLSRNFRITAVDQDEASLRHLRSTHPDIETRQADLTDFNFGKLLDKADLVVSAVPGHLGFSTLKKIIEAKKNVVDISFFPQDPFELDAQAKAKNVTAVVDCGVAPGMGNIILGYYDKVFKVERYECLVGGLPEKRAWPWQYKAVFSPIDVIEEYIRPARIVIGGNLVVREALSDPELIDFDEIGTLESFNTDGLRTLIRTMKIPNMIEKTLRYPGTIEYIRVLKSGGFFSYDPVELDGKKIRPVDFSSKMLFPQWKLEEGERDITIMKILISGVNEKGAQQTVSFDLLDRYDTKNNILSMARTTGYTCCAVGNLIINGKITKKGILPPEKIGEDEENFDFVIDYLKDRNVIYNKRQYGA